MILAYNFIVMLREYSKKIVESVNFLHTDLQLLSMYILFRKDGKLQGLAPPLSL